MSRGIGHYFDVEIRELHEAGFSMTEIAERLYIARATVRRRLLAMELTLRSKHRHQPTALPHSHHEITIRMYRDQKLSTREIGEILGISMYTVRDRLERAGVPRRGKSEVNRLRRS